MKKISYLMAMAIVVLGFTACTDDDTAQQGQQTSGIDLSWWPAGVMDGLQERR